MPKKSYKITGGHHTRTNAKNVKRNQGDPWRRRKWRQYWKRKEKNERKKVKQKTRRIISDILIFIALTLFFGIIFWLGMK